MDERLGELIRVPAGNFLMGSVGDEEYCAPTELPQHEVYVAEFEIGKYEVTRGEYRRFIEDGGYQDPSYWSDEGWEWVQSGITVHSGMYGSKTIVEGDGPRTAPEHWEPEQEWVGHGHGHPRFTQTDDHPVVGVSYYEAEAYCNWAGGRLPTEEEWEKAARWDEANQHSRIWPWGDEWDPEKCNNPDDHNPIAGGHMVNQSAPVGSYPDGASPCGCMDMVGNAWEWTSNWAKSYDGCEEPFDFTGEYVFVRGGCWDDGPSAVRCASRGWYVPKATSGTGDTDSDYPGFRVAR